MADVELKSFPFDSMKVLNEESRQMEDDRVYDAQIFRDYFRKFLSNGVYFGHYKNYGENSMKVVLDNGLNIKVLKGCGIIEGADYENENDTILVLERPSNGNRIDRIVVQMNASLDTRTSKLIVKQGKGETPAELTRTDNIYEICIAEVTVKSTSNISEGDIKDTRLDKELCGVVGSLISIDGEQIYQNFKDYVETVKSDLILRNEFAMITEEVLMRQGEEFTELKINYPEGFNFNNCVVIAKMYGDSYGLFIGNNHEDFTGDFFEVNLYPTYIYAKLKFSNALSLMYAGNIKIILMKT